MENQTWQECDYLLEPFVVVGRSVTQKFTHIPSGKTIVHKVTIKSKAKQFNLLQQLFEKSNTNSKNLEHIPLNLEDQKQAMFECLFYHPIDMICYKDYIKFRSNKLTELNNEEQKLWDEVLKIAEEERIWKRILKAAEALKTLSGSEPLNDKIIRRNKNDVKYP